MRKIIGGGDEITIVCNARKALDVVREYFKSLEETNNYQQENYSACAGVAVCHSHAPFADVYAIAEACCESGKKRIKALGGDAGEACYVDAYFCRSAITADLETLREKQAVARTKMPYCISGNDGDHSFDKFLAIGRELKKIKRTNVKALRDAAFVSKPDFELELMRIKSNAKETLSIGEEDYPMVCDASEFFDLWFEGETENV